MGGSPIAIRNNSEHVLNANTGYEGSCSSGLTVARVFSHLLSVTFDGSYGDIEAFIRRQAD